ncbi:hypothetical protein MPH_02586 [Macrophomina phaseolina MS6]|uniref:Uncharacterized protein n=2 Tax=Macrophomina phaseolina TaxID=35725 RepID=K2S536_MACPH|nr:hypothetical protein MPH_02586 [Macrophomina phaseolina MS6]KAH7045877.1 hypothetical protein B0J12DRAFT_669010 [Macrophomina phaseolina]
MSQTTNCERGELNDAPLDPFGPPKLYYSLHTRKKQIARFWVPLLIDCCLIPVALYYSLRFSTRLSNANIFAITTALTGGTLILEFFIRGYQLWKADSACRVKGAPRAYFDWTHWVFLVAILVAVVELVVGNAYPRPIIRLLAMPVPSVLLVFAAEALMRDLLHLFQRKSPVRISSCPKGAQFRPGIYSILEDIVATDGGGMAAYRERLGARYRSSYRFRHMLRTLSLFWSLGGTVAALGTSSLVWTLDVSYAYAVGWVAPYIWGLIWTLLTIRWVHNFIQLEYASWAEARNMPML